MLDGRGWRSVLLEIAAIPLGVLQVLRLDYNVVVLVEFVLEITTNASNSKGVRLRLAVYQFLIHLTSITITAHPTISCDEIITSFYLFLCLSRNRRKGVFIIHKTSIFDGL